MRDLKRYRLFGSATDASAVTRRGGGGKNHIDPIEQRTLEIGSHLITQARKHERGLLSQRFWRDRFIDWAMQDRAFKTALFRFVDVFPTLRTPEQIRVMLDEYLRGPGIVAPPGLGLTLRAGRAMPGTLARTVMRQVRAMARQFIAAEFVGAALPILQDRWKQGTAFSIDLLGEACLSAVEARAYRRQYLELIRTLPELIKNWPTDDRLERDHLSDIPRVNLSLKITSLHEHVDPVDFEGTLERLQTELTPLLEAAARRNVLINFDIEQHEYKALTYALFKRCSEAVNFPAGVAMQAYLRSGESDARDMVHWARTMGRQVTVRLVKGAYWDYEVAHAQQHGWPLPVWSRKAETDACFERMSQILIDGSPRNCDEGGTLLAVGSHNARSIAHALAWAEARELPPSAVEVQMLFGMADPLKLAAVEMGLRVREYVPVGQMIPGMAYLVRRLLENTSNESWLRAGFADEVSTETLLASPQAVVRTMPPVSQSSIRRDHEQHQHAPTNDRLADGRPFINEPHRDFADLAQRRAFSHGIEKIVVPHITFATTAQQATDVVRRAREAFTSWRQTSVIDRARLLLDVARLMRGRRDELAGIMIREAGKTWREADADVCEAIDFCEFYARCAVPLMEPQTLGHFAGEQNQQWYQPRGVAVVISPWNFPLAICTGMTAAAFVTGNAVIVKPAEQTPAIAKVLCELFWQAGVPTDVLHFLPGPGEVVGAALVRDPRVAIIAFTGSKAVGLDIIEAAGRTPTEQPHVKRVVCEMGGKNAIIVDESADLDEAVMGVRSSAFSFAGQKCSACSRVIVVGQVYDTFVPRLIEATRALKVDDPIHPATEMGPVIDDEAARKIRQYIEIGKDEGRLELAVEVSPELSERFGKPFVGPHIFSGLRSDHRLAQEEIFGPVLSIMHATDFEDALRIANGTAYKLTGGVYSRRPSHLQRAHDAFAVGNLYLNRGITGALVGRQPFGGFGLSGFGLKAGGRDYLLQFVEPRVCTENTMRRGFTPEL